MTPRTDRQRLTRLVVMTVILGGVIFFLLQSYEDPRWGGGYWDRWLMEHFRMPFRSAHAVVFGLRKSIHFIGYGLLGLFFRSYFACARFKAAPWLGIFAASAVACLDEFLQSRTTFRTGKPADVLLDIAGILFFAATTAIIGRHGKRR